MRGLASGLIGGFGGIGGSIAAGGGAAAAAVSLSGGSSLTSEKLGPALTALLSSIMGSAAKPTEGVAVSGSCIATEFSGPVWRSPEFMVETEAFPDPPSQPAAAAAAFTLDDSAGAAGAVVAVDRGFADAVDFLADPSLHRSSSFTCSWPL